MIRTDIAGADVALTHTAPDGDTDSGLPARTDHYVAARSVQGSFLVSGPMPTCHTPAPSWSA